MNAKIIAQSIAIIRNVPADTIRACTAEEEHLLRQDGYERANDYTRARILTLSLPDPARHPRAEDLIAAIVEDLIDGGALADGAIDRTALAARLRTDYARAVGRAVATDGIGDPLCDTSATSWRVPADSDDLIVTIDLAPADATADCWITDTARDPVARNQAAMVLTTIALAIDTGNDALADALARGTAGIPMTLTPQDLPLPSESEALYALEDCHYEAVQSWLEEYDWQALVDAAIRDGE